MDVVMSTSEPLTVPSTQDIRDQIEARRCEISCLKRLLKLAHATEMAREARQRQRPLRNLTGGPIHAS
jgi:hypothetical protein